LQDENHKTAVANTDNVCFLNKSKYIIDKPVNEPRLLLFKFFRMFFMKIGCLLKTISYCQYGGIIV
jgi:hypothetical protein